MQMGAIGFISTGTTQNKTKRGTDGSVWGYLACRLKHKKNRKSARMIAVSQWEEGIKGGEFRGS